MYCPSNDFPSSESLVAVFLVAEEVQKVEKVLISELVLVSELVLMSELALVYNTTVHPFDHRMIVVAWFVLVENLCSLHDKFAVVMMPLDPCY